MKNPIIPMADPFVLLHEGKYYLYGTTDFNRDNNTTELDGKDGVRVFVSDDLEHWELSGYCLKKGDTIGEHNFWAPELLYKNGKFYMAYTSEEHIGIAVSDSPTGPFVQTEKKWICPDFAIDGHFLDEGDKVYLYYVRVRGAHNTKGNTVFVARMNEDMTEILQQTETMLIRAEDAYPWEVRDCHVAEGPFVLKHGGKYYLTYSANHTRSHDYAVGYAVSESPTGPFVRYRGNPILRSGGSLLGTGHHSFTTSKDGKRLICAYHVHNGPEKLRPRLFCVDAAEFVKNPDGGDDILVIHGPSEESTAVI